MDEVGIVVPFGELDMAGGDMLRAAVQSPEANRPLRLDLAGVTFIDPAGVRVLLELADLEKQRGHEMTVTAISTQVERVLRLVHVAQVFGLDGDNPALERRVG